MITQHDFRRLMWGHNLASVEIHRKRRLFRPDQITVTGTCWTYKPVHVGDTFIWTAAPRVEVTAEITKVTPAPNVDDMSFWEGVITSHTAAEIGS